MRKLLKNHKGLTMVEVLVTVALLAIVIVPCLSSFVVAQRGNVLAKQTFDEYTAAANLMETLKSLQVPDDSEWDAEMRAALSNVQVNATDNISVFAEFVESDSYCEIRIYAGEIDGEEPEDQEGLILKGVIAP